ncbi:MAG: hypothetical protein O9336_20870, partial [Microcystis sp. LE19-98.1E]|nr:hypothetical protein [Microcystis sp. LE19-98.1E]
GWAHAVRPYGFWGGWVFWGFVVGVGRTRGAPTGVGGGFWGFLVGVGRTRPDGFWGGWVFWGFQEKYVGVNCDRL